MPDIGCHHGTLYITLQDHLCILCTNQQVVHYKQLPMGQTITANLYSQQLECVQQALKQKEPALVNHKSVLFLHNNARPQVARDIIQWLNWETPCHPPYPSDPADNNLLHSLHKHLSWKSKSPDFYCQGIAQLEAPWQKVLNADGDYFED